MTSRVRRISMLCALCGLGAMSIALSSRPIRAERLITYSAFDAAPLRSRSAAQIELTMRTPSVMEIVSLSVHQAQRRAHLATVAQSYDEAMSQARALAIQGHVDEAKAIARAVLDHLGRPPSTPPQGEALAAPAAPGVQGRNLSEKRLGASLMLARLELLDHRPVEALEQLDAMQGAETPIEDYIGWIRAQALEEAEQFERAHDAYARVAAMSQSPLAHRARVQRAHMLYRGGDYEHAVVELEQVNALYPDYPRRHISLFQQGRALEELGRLDEAARVYQTTWFEFPFKERGELAKGRLDALKAQGYSVPEIDARTRYKRWRRLRINKHWDTARALFRELADEVAAEQGEKSAMVHEIWQQLALNAMIPKRYEEAEYYLELLKSDYESGQRAGIDRGLVYRTLADVRAKFGDLEGALNELDHASSSPLWRKQARAEFLYSHGRYSRARALYDELGTLPKRGWTYSWLLYKSNRLTEAHRNFLALAASSAGRNQAKYLYWAARTKERLDDPTEARKLYKQVYALRPHDYYGFQATSRLIDMDEREQGSASKGSALLERAASVLDTTDEAIKAFEEVVDEESGLEGDDEGLALDLSEARGQQRAAHLGQDNFSGLLEPTLCVEDEQVTRSSICQIASATGLELRTTAHAERGPLKLEQRARQGATAFDPVSRPDVGQQASSGALTRPAHLPARRPRPKLLSEDNRASRTLAVKPARIFWEGPQTSPLRFLQYDEQERAIGPHPKTLNAYGEDQSYVGGLDRLIASYGEHFEELERARWLMRSGMNKEARWAIRDVALEFRALSKLSAPRREPHQLRALRMTPLIDNRRVEKATWGYIESDYRWPVPKERAAKQALLERQRAIISERDTIKPLLIDAMKEVGDYYMVRQFTRGTRARTKEKRMQLYPRAFPDLVVPLARRWGVNPYVIWALMIVESSFNPDSVSTAEALGLLQVIPRTGLKTAELLDDEDFGHYDLLDEDVALHHGVFYFSRLVRKFHGNELLAMAGYNGGPHRVAEWIDMRGDMPMDEFVEEIPYDQAREYTKKVSRFLHLFLRLYEGQDSLYIGNRLSREWRPMPNF